MLSEHAERDDVFQSPSNRVKCSDELQFGRRLRPDTRFNPLAIGSNVLINVDIVSALAVDNLFQSPSNRVKCSDVIVESYEDEKVVGFNPLAIGSNVLILPAVAQRCPCFRSFNPLAIGSNVLIYHEKLDERCLADVSIP